MKKKNLFLNNHSEDFFKSCKTIIQNMSGDPELREQRVNELVEKNYGKIMKAESDDSYNAHLRLIEWIKGNK